MDSGIDHADLNVVERVDFQTDGAQGDPDGHGTHVAGTLGALDNATGVLGVAPGVSIHDYRVLDATGNGDVSVVIAAVEEITKQKLANPSTPMVVNMSIGEDIGTTQYTALDEAIQHSISLGVVYVISAGNYGEDADEYTPAHVEGAITVGSFRKDRGHSWFSNHGAKVDILAPGEDVLSLAPDGGLDLMSGTSMAAAHVSGGAVRYLADNPSASAAQVLSALLSTSGIEVENAPAATSTAGLSVQSTLGLDIRVSSSYDDAEERRSNGDMYRTSSDLELSHDGSTDQLIGIRFRDLRIPAGAVITRAYVQFTVDETNSGATSLTISGQAADNAAYFSSSDYDISSRAKTASSVAWSPAPWTSVGAAGEAQRTPDVTAILNEITSRPGWASGNSLVLMLEGTGERTAESYNGSSSRAPVLHIEGFGFDPAPASSWTGCDDDDECDDD